ncbi:MAG TPA: hypothetical protein ENH24_05170 [Nitrospirae bacterium]|nr:hypothetical protein [Nitrospirota bacterium]
MTKAKKIGLMLIIIGMCLPTATLPFITEFNPVPEICLTSNFFKNMGNMIVVFGSEAVSPLIAIPYRYLFSIGVVLVCTGLGILVMTSGKPFARKGS